MILAAFVREPSTAGNTMNKVVMDATIPLDGWLAAPSDGKAFPLGKNDGEHILRREP
jgi:hypothetical protein